MNTILRKHIRTGCTTSLATVKRKCCRMTERIGQLHPHSVAVEAEAMDAVEAMATEAEEMVDMAPPNKELNSSNKPLMI